MKTPIGDRTKMPRTCATRMRFFASAAFAAVVVATLGDARSTSAAEASNQVVIMIDGSGSYLARQDQAFVRTVSLLDAMAERRLRRWEGTTDRITLISLDAMPATLWEGTLKELKAIDRSAWSSRFKARTDYTSCTDVGGAFRLATEHFKGESLHVSKYLFVFSDLIDEPPTTSMRRCKAASAAPPSDFPWDSLAGISTAVFWMPPDQKLIWHRAAVEHKLEASFALYTVSESAEVSILPPPPAQVKLSEEDQQANRKALSQFVWNGVKVVFVLPVMVVGGILVIVAGSVIYRRRRASRALASRRAGRPTVRP